MLSAGMSPAQWTGKTSPDLPARGPVLVWEQEAAGSNPAIPTRSEHMSIFVPRSVGANLGGMCYCRAWPTARGALTARTRSTSITPPIAGTGNITVAAQGDGGARSLWVSALTASRSAARSRRKTEVKDKLRILHDELFRDLPVGTL